MVDLPTPQRRLVTTEAPRDGVSARERAAAGAVLGRGLSNFGKGLEDVAVELAKNEATENVNKAVSFDANGKVQVDTPQTSFLLNARAADAYEKTVNDRVAPHVRTQVDQDLLDIRQKHQGNPDAYRKEASAYLEKWKNQDDAVGRIAFPYAERVASGHYSNEVTAKSARDLSVARKEVDGRLDMLRNKIAGLAESGAMNTPEGIRSMAEYKELLDRKQANPLNGYSAELRRQDEENFTNDLTVASVGGKARRYFEATGDKVGALKMAQEEVEKLPLSPNQKTRVLGQINSRMYGSSVIRATQTKELVKSANEKLLALQNGDLFDEKEIRDLAGKLVSVGQHAKAARLLSENSTQLYRGMILYGDAAEKAEGMAAVRSITQKGFSVAGGAAGGRIVDTRGRDNPSNFTAMPTEIQGKFKALSAEFGRPLVITPHGGVRHNPSLRNSQHASHNRRAMDISTDGMSDEDKARLIATAVRMGAGGIGTYAVGSGQGTIHIDWRDRKPGAPPTSWHWDAQGKDGWKAGRAFSWHKRGVSSGLSSDPIAGPAVASGNTKLPFIKQAATQIEKEYGAQFKALAVPAMAMLKDGKTLPDDTIAELAAMLPFVERTKENQKLEADLIVAAKAKGMKVETLQAIVDRNNERAKTGEMKPAEYVFAKSVEAQNEAHKAGLKESPLDEGRKMFGRDDVIFGDAKSINWDDPVAREQALIQRRYQSEIMQEHDQAASAMPLYRADMTEVISRLQQSDSAGVSNILNSMAKVFNRDQMAAIMQHKEFKGAVMSMLDPANPAKMNAGYAFLDKFARENGSLFLSIANKETEKKLAGWQAKVGTGLLTPDEYAKRLLEYKSPESQAEEKRRGKELTKTLSKVTPANVVDKVSGRWFGSPYDYTPVSANNADAAALKFEYESAYREYFQNTNPDHAEADKYATEHLKRRWSPSVVNGGRLTRLAPESVLGPAAKINGSYDWLKDQLRSDLESHLGGIVKSPGGFTGADVTGLLDKDMASAPATQPRGPTGDPEKMTKAAIILSQPYFIQADTRTEQEIASGRTPSYQIIVRDKNGMSKVLMDEDNQPFRWQPDMRSVAEEARNAAKGKDKAHRDFVRGLKDDSPFNSYQGWARGMDM